MQRKIKKALIQKQHILDHVTKAFSLVIAVKVIPAHLTQTRLERLLHAEQLVRTEKIRHDNDTVRLEFRRQRINFRRPEF